MGTIRDFLFGTLNFLGILLIIGLGLVQFWLGWIGIEHHLNSWAAGAAFLVALWMRILLPITIGSYFGVVDVIGWPWWAGLLIAAPGIIFSIPLVVSHIIDAVYELFKTYRQ